MSIAFKDRFSGASGEASNNSGLKGAQLFIKLVFLVLMIVVVATFLMLLFELFNGNFFGASFCEIGNSFNDAIYKWAGQYLLK